MNLGKTKTMISTKNSDSDWNLEEQEENRRGIIIDWVGIDNVEERMHLWQSILLEWPNRESQKISSSRYSVWKVELNFKLKKHAQHSKIKNEWSGKLVIYQDKCIEIVIAQRVMERLMPEICWLTGEENSLLNY